MSFYIPEWLLWLAGVPLGIIGIGFIGVCAYIGFMFFKSFDGAGGNE